MLQYWRIQRMAEDVKYISGRCQGYFKTNCRSILSEERGMELKEKENPKGLKKMFSIFILLVEQ